MRGSKSLLLLLAGSLGTAVAGMAHVRLHNPSNGASLYWRNPEAVSIVVGSTGSDDFGGDSHTAALRNAIDVWNQVGETSAQLVEDASPESRARTDWGADDLHLIWFDENNSSGFFPPGSGTVAVTPVWFFSSGEISDADIIFNGSGFQFTTSQETGRFDVQDVATHEIGHLLGFDHSGWAGATMYPYVDPTILLHRSLSLDEVAAMRSTYPVGATASLTGVVARKDGSARVAGAHVVARDANGRTAGGTLSNVNGTFHLSGLQAGTYTVYATPLDEPVSSLNLTTGHTVEVDFESAVLDGTFTVASDQTLPVGTILVDDDIALNLGRNVDRYPRRVISGLTNLVLIRGSGLNFGSTLEASSPDVTVFPVDWVGFQVSFQAMVAPDAAPGHVDLTVTDLAGNIAILPAGLEITPPSPTITNIEPAIASVAGGTQVRVRGTGFRPGLRVVVGGEVYVDGAPGGCTRVDSNELTLTARSASAGDYDVVVIDESGVEGRSASGLRVDLVPVIAEVFPAGGKSAGGTRVTVVGASFDEGATVRIGDQLQPNATVVNSTRIEIVTEPFDAGGPYDLVVTNANNLSVTRAEAFAFSGLPDPILADIEPSEGLELGGDIVTLHGTDLRPDTQVIFGLDPETGASGVLSPDVTFVSDQMLIAVTPEFGAGTTSVAVRDAETGQAGVLGQGFTFTPEPQPASSGGGCATVSTRGGEVSWRTVADGYGWMAILSVALLYRRKRFIAAATAPSPSTAPPAH